MSNNALLGLMGCALVLSAVAADYGLGKLDVPKPHKLPVEGFPAVVGDWKAGPVHQVDPDIQKRLPTAKIVERDYVNPTGQVMTLMLLTATEDEDMHSPKACFPSQGWTLSDVKDTQVAGQPMTRMTADMDGQGKLAVLYWLTGYYAPAPPRNALLRKASVWRTHSMGAHSNMSLFVRITAPDTPLNDRAMTSFTSALQDPLNALVRAGATAS